MYLIAKNPVMAEVEIPIKRIEKFISLFIKWGISTSPAPKIIGVASRKEKRAAARALDAKLYFLRNFLFSLFCQKTKEGIPPII